MKMKENICLQQLVSLMPTFTIDNDCANKIDIINITPNFAFFPSLFKIMDDDEDDDDQDHISLNCQTEN